MSFVGRVGLYSYGSQPTQKVYFFVLKGNSGHYANKLFIGTILASDTLYRNHIVREVEYSLSRIEWL